MNLTAWLAELEHLSHKQRVRRLLELGRQEAEQREPILDALTQGTVYERRLALYACFTSRDTERLARAALDPSRFVHGLATRLLARWGSEEQCLSLLRTLPPQRVRAFLGAYRHDRRSSAPIDTWWREQLEQGERQLTWKYLGYGSAALVREQLPAHLERGLHPRTVRHHAKLVLEALLEQAQASQERQAALTAQANKAVRVASAEQPDLALALLRELERTTPLAHLALWPLLHQRSAGLAELLLSSEDKAQALNLSGVLRRLPPELIQRLITQRPQLVPDLGSVYPRWSWERRQALAATVCQREKDAQDVLSPLIVGALPTPDRLEEARRHWSLPYLRSRPLRQLPYAAFLPFAEALELLRSLISDPKPELRAAALSSLIGTLRYDQRQHRALLPFLTARRNEQDPVRQAIFSALAELPPSLWDGADQSSLDQLIHDALNAADLSHGTAQALERWLLGILPFQPQWAAQHLAEVVRVRGQVGWYSLEDRLSAHTAPIVLKTLEPVLQAWAERERESQLLQAARALGRHLKRSEPLLKLLEERIQQSKQAWISQQALELLREHTPPRFAQLMPELLQKDPSWITVAVVREAVHRHRQDLLTPFLGRKAFKGRFSTGKTRLVLPFMKGFERWTHSQQQLFTTTLVELLSDRKRDHPSLWQAIAQLAALPALGLLGVHTNDAALQALTELAALSNQQLALRDRALRALARLDEGRGVETLLEALADDRGRIAIYALRRSLLRLPAARALELLQRAPLQRVTVAKEVLRLIGDLSGEAAFQALLALNQRELHRDVRIALLRAFWSHLHRPETWPILLDAARNPDPALSDGLVRLPGQQLGGASRERYLELFCALLSHPVARVRVEALQGAGTITDPQRQALDAVLGALGAQDDQESALAARLLFASYAAQDAPIIAQSFEALLPERRALQTALSALQGAAQQTRIKAQPIIKAVIAALASDPVTLAWQAKLAISTFAWPALTQFLRSVTEQIHWHPEALMSAVQELQRVQRSDLTKIETLETALRAGNELARRLALAALVNAAQQDGGWTPERLDRLKLYRQDPSLLVSSAAQWILPAAEQQESHRP